VKRVGFRGRLFTILVLFALVPVIVLTIAWEASIRWAIPLVGATGAVEHLTATGDAAIRAARANPALTPADRAAIEAHRRALDESTLRARQITYLANRAPTVMVGLAIGIAAFLAIVASRVAGHLSRLLGRPLAELVTWAERIGRGEPLPDGPPRRGAPEFAALRAQMRTMAAELQRGRERELEAQRLEAFRETARQVAHELKNPLTPIRFAVSRLSREAPPALRDTVDVLVVESERLERMARSFAEFGRLPGGPRALVDVAALLRYSARATVPDTMRLELELPAEEVLMVDGNHDALAGAVANVLINAVEACRGHGTIAVRARRTGEEVVVTIEDSGEGIPASSLGRMWEPYVTSKAGGTGLGLAIVRQTIHAHCGRVDARSGASAGTMIELALPAATAVESSPPGAG